MKSAQTIELSSGNLVLAKLSVLRLLRHFAMLSSTILMVKSVLISAQENCSDGAGFKILSISSNHSCHEVISWMLAFSLFFLSLNYLCTRFHDSCLDQILQKSKISGLILKFESGKIASILIAIIMLIGLVIVGHVIWMLALLGAATFIFLCTQGKSKTEPRILSNIILLVIVAVTIYLNVSFEDNRVGFLIMFVSVYFSRELMLNLALVVVNQNQLIKNRKKIKKA